MLNIELSLSCKSASYYIQSRANSIYLHLGFANKIQHIIQSYFHITSIHHITIPYPYVSSSHHTSTPYLHIIPTYHTKPIQAKTKVPSVVLCMFHLGLSHMQMYLYLSPEPNNYLPQDQRNNHHLH